MDCLARQHEWRAVLEHAGCGGQGETAGAEQVAVERVVDQPPGMRTQSAGDAADQALRPTVLL